jgi:hypothetical protein
MKNRLFVSSILLNIALCVGCLFFGYNFIDSYGRSAYRYDEFIIFSENISAQNILLKTLIKGYSEEQVLAIARNEIEKYENKEMELRADNNSITFEGLKIILKNRKAVDIEFKETVEADKFKYLTGRFQPWSAAR